MVSEGRRIVTASHTGRAPVPPHTGLHGPEAWTGHDAPGDRLESVVGNGGHLRWLQVYFIAKADIGRRDSATV